MSQGRRDRNVAALWHLGASLGLESPGSAATKVWSDRVAEFLEQSGSRSIIVCHEESGIEWAIRRLELSGTPIIRIWFDAQLTESSIANVLVSAINDVFGHDLVPPGASLEQSLSTLEQFAMRVGPIRIVVGWLGNCPGVVEQILKLNSSMFRVLVVASQKDEALGQFGLNVIDAGFLRMRPEEADVASSAEVNREQLSEVLSRANGRFGTFLKLLGSQSDLGATFESSGEREVSLSAPFSGVTEAFIWALWERGRFVEAFELACTDCLRIVPRIIDRAGNYFFDRGAFHFLWDCLRALPEELKMRPRVAYWLYVSAAATNNLSKVQKHAIEVLKASDAPELRAAVAVMRPDVNIDHETEWAMSVSENATTVRARAFALALGGDRHGPILLLRRAMVLAESVDANHLVVASALDISNQEITLGRLQSGRNWALWALQQLEVRQLSEEYRRQTALAGLAFSGLLMGDLKETRVILDFMNPKVENLGIPTYESVISTLGDWCLYEGDYLQAEFYYKQVLAKSPISQYASAALDIVKLYIVQDEVSAAIEQAERAYSLSRSSSILEKSFGALSLGIAQAMANSPSAIPLLEEALSGFRRTSYAIFEAQALLWLALWDFLHDDFEGARRFLEAASPITCEFGQSGWQFLLANHVQTSFLQSILTDDEPRISLSFLGDSSVTIGGDRIRPSKRHCEVLAFLADRPNGITNERLHLLLFGEYGKTATAKATVSRLRKLVPITTAPYRLQSKVDADFVQVLRNIEEGQLHRAVLLYKGPLLPESDAPGIVELRDHISEAIRSSVLASNDPDLLIDLGTILEDDLQVWEAARASLGNDDRRRPLVAARIRRVKSSW